MLPKIQHLLVLSCCLEFSALGAGLSDTRDPGAASSIQAVFSAAPSDREKAVRNLGSELDSEERGYLLTFLLSPERCGAQIHSFINEVMNALDRQKRLPEGYEAALVAISQSDAYDVVTRDYALQHMRRVYQHSAKKDLLCRSLLAATDDKRDSLAGTALLGLAFASTVDPAVNVTNVNRAILKVLTEEAYTGASRIAALQAGAIAGSKEVLPIARRIIQEETVNEHLRLSAIAAVGLMGDAQDLTLLESLKIAPTDRLVPARTKAIENLNDRLGGPPSSKQEANL